MAKNKNTTNTPPSLEFLDIDLIARSPLNPRKVFDEEELQSLSESIKKIGLIQPITVRKTIIASGNNYELICGERRWRASKLAGLTEIPASVRDVSDSEAMELMVTENLQRKDVHPLEEAGAFQFMLDKMNYSVLDISAKIGKNEAFVVRRLQLLKLIPELAAIFKTNELSIGHAELLSRVELQSQQLWYNDKYMARWQGGQGTVRDLKDWLSNKTENRLSDAIFYLDQPYRGEHYVSDTCTTCRLNSSVNQTLFPDTAEKAICNGPQCFKAKTNAEFQVKLDSALQDPNVYLIGGSKWDTSDLAKNILSEGHSILNRYHDYDELTKPELISYTEDVDREDYDSDEEFNTAMLEAQASFDEDLIAFQEKEHLSIKGFDINTGHTKHVILSAPKASGNNTASADPSKELKEQLSALQQKFERGRELDDEKVMGYYVNHIRNGVTISNMTFPNQFELSDLELTAMVCLSYEKADYEYKRKVRQLLFTNANAMSQNNQDYKLFDAIHNAPVEIRNLIVRNAIFNTFSGVYPKGINGGVIFGLSGEWEAEAYNKFRETQDGIKARREAKLKPQIDALIEKINVLPGVNNQSQTPAKA